jgi:MOSC domain-containing protein YiiM
MDIVVASVSSDNRHRFSKPITEQIELLTGLGVAGDAHAGVTVQHLFRMRTDPNQPNLRQVHLIAAELFDELAGRGFTVGPGDLGENLTTQGVDLLALPRGAVLRLGEQAVLELTGLRNPCRQINGVQPGLMRAVLDQDEAGNVVRKAGVMAVVLAGGPVRPGDQVRVELPAEPHQRLEPV